MRILFALPGLHLLDRGAEVAFISVADALVKSGEHVTLIGSGPDRARTAYAYLRAPCVARDHFGRFPSIPFLRDEYTYEDLTFAPSLLRRYRPASYDVTVTCNYPYTNWVLRRPVLSGRRPPHVFVTQNGDWPARRSGAEFRYFGCDGLVCTNPDYYERNKDSWRCGLIPNGVDIERFKPGPSRRSEFDLPEHRTVVLMVSALVDYKRVAAGIEAVSLLPDAHLAVAGDGPLRKSIVEMAAKLLPGRFTLVSAPPSRMPDLYSSASVLLHLAFEEAFGNVFVEALACGLPVVGHDSPRLRWIVGDCGFLLDTTDSRDIAPVLALAAAKTFEDRDRRVARAAKFSWSRIGDKYREFLSGVVESYRARPD